MDEGTLEWLKIWLVLPDGLLVLALSEAKTVRIVHGIMLVVVGNAVLAIEFFKLFASSPLATTLIPVLALTVALLSTEQRLLGLSTMLALAFVLVAARSRRLSRGWWLGLRFPAAFATPAAGWRPELVAVVFFDV